MSDPTPNTRWVDGTWKVVGASIVDDDLGVLAITFQPTGPRGVTFTVPVRASDCPQLNDRVMFRIEVLA